MQNFIIDVHTRRCGHAIGEDYEYIEHAIGEGIDYIGFADHLGYKDWITPNERMYYADVPNYIDDIRELKIKYKDKIHVLVGFEFEYFQDELEYLKCIREEVDYMIIGQHSKNRSGYNYNLISTDEDVKIYCAQIISAIDHGLVDIISHIDYFMLGRKDINKVVEESIRQVIIKAKENNVAIELNLKGMLKGEYQFDHGLRYIYPHKEIWEIIGEYKPKIVIGYDVHIPSFIRKRYLEKDARNWLKNFGLKAVENFDELNIKNKG